MSAPLVENLKALQFFLKSKKVQYISQADEIEIVFNQETDKREGEGLAIEYDLRPESFNKLSFIIKNEYAGLYLFHNQDSLFDFLSLHIEILDNKNIFVFDVDDHFLFYDFNSQIITTDSSQQKNIHLISHYKQYKQLLDIYLREDGKLFEVKKSSTNEFIIFSRGEVKSVTSITYKTVDKYIFTDDFKALPIKEFEQNIYSEDWLACYNDTLCQYIEAQSTEKRTLSNLYNNFEYVFNLTKLNFQLYVSRFSFDKIRKQFKIEKNTYFENLNIAQDKVSSQIISVPLSLGASILSFYNYDGSRFVLVLTFVGVLCYCFFITYVVIMSLYDVQKVARDIVEEENNFKRYYLYLYEELKTDFNYMRNKRRRVRFLAWAIIITLLIVVFCVGVFSFTYKEKTVINTLHLLTN